MVQTFKRRDRSSMARGAKKARNKTNGRAQATVAEALSEVFAAVDARQKAAPRGGG